MNIVEIKLNDIKPYEKNARKNDDAVKSAKLKGTSYDDAVDKWLKGNAKKYGYKYTKQK